ncbi:MAG: tetratricopeptide repeat protein [Acidobacteriaceae bacterium]|nr:tetratricopeptide repeat protein [Acidobacteriaceae bacterium]
MKADELVRSGRLDEAIQVLVAELRDQPADSRRRTFLFELLCFAGQYDRAEKHLSLLAQTNQDTEVGALLYRSALAAERKRHGIFELHDYPAHRGGTKPSRAGTLNGKPFRSIEDFDPRIGPRLEMFVAGEYVWLPFEHIGSIRMSAPRYLRDTLWATAIVQTGPSFKGQEFGEVLLPVLSPFSWQHDRDEVKLGRATDWKQVGEELIPFGQKLFLIDDEEAVPMLEIRELTFAEVPQQEPSNVVIASE